MNKGQALRSALLITRDSQPDALRRALLEAGYQGISIVETTEAVRTARPHVILFDLGANERELVREIPKLARRLSGVPIVVVASEQMIGTALEAGAADAVTRPVRIIELAARLERVRRMRERDHRHTLRERKLSDAIGRLESVNRDLEMLACVDALTGVSNRKHVLALLDAESRRALRDRTPLAAIMIDLDGFHGFNEVYGHPEGDRCLQRVVDAMAHCLRRPSDFLGRYGGEEFLAVLPSTSAGGAAIVCERLRAAVAGLAIPHAASPCARVVTISLGFACLTRGDYTATRLIATADDALLRAKAAGRNRAAGEAAPAPAPRQPPDRWKRFTPVVADPWFADRIPQLLTSTRETAGLVTRAVHDSTLEQIPPLARKLKAASIEYGLEHVTLLASSLEHAARVCDSRSITELADELVEYVDHVQIVYRREDQSNTIVLPR